MSQVNAREEQGDRRESDVLVIGGGPAGATAAVYAARAGWRTLVVDKGIHAGALGMSAKIANFPGFPDTPTGAAIISRIREQAVGFGAAFADDKITAARLDGEEKTLWGAKGAYCGRAVIIATGSMGRDRSIPGEERLVGRGVSYCATCDGFFFQGRSVAVAGTTDEAVEEALFLTRFAQRVHLLVPTPSLRVGDVLVSEIERNDSIVVHPRTTVQEIVGASQVEGVRITRRGEDPTTLEVGGVFLYLQGGRPIIDFLGGQVPTTPEGCLMVDQTFQTRIPGVFAAGDVLCKHLKQAVIAAAEGASAAVAADRLLSGREKLKPDWS